MFAKMVSWDFIFAATLQFGFVHIAYVLGVGMKVWAMVERGHIKTCFHILPKHFLDISAVAFASTEHFLGSADCTLSILFPQGISFIISINVSETKLVTDLSI